ncbi:UBX domain-containing protein 4 isoform X2 [Bicyclus anynana]|uniref:UBX domain-containing protein 4 n=1 Tax=Bicyclus anynana TaxID=110368 RepID=A0ABM3LUL8_BICAN|nr:UBX domain-containing protein 4 isoform X1 [Bicyclus anynana]XP_052742764.1 UBX domain-containing protein 4 isoform X2 [Bicyclus anynana]
MHWYGGSIAEAVALSKKRNAIFVVFIADDKEPSLELAATLDDSAVLKRLTDESNFLSIKLMSDSENYTFFAQIYQFVPVPSLFFIGRNGTPLEVVCPGVNSEQLATRIDRILEEHRQEHKPGSVQPSTSSRNIKDETVNFMQTEAAALTSQSQPKPDSTVTPAVIAPSAPQSAPSAPQSAPSAPQPAPSAPQPAPSVPQTATKNPANDDEPETSGPAAKVQKTEHPSASGSGQEYDVICDGDVCVRRPRTEQPGPSQPAPDSAPVTENESPSADDKMDKVQEILLARRREKEEKEKELEKQKEIERRAVGQGVAELKRWQADQELKQIQEERKREKMENNLARQRILEQIAQDRAERKAREAPPPAPAQITPPTSVGDSTGRARVQFKMADGAAHTAHFDVTATLGDVQRYVSDNLQMSRSSFTLWTAFPRRELTDEAATLQHMQLVPSAALLVLPRRAADAVAAPSTTFANIITFITQIFTTIVLDPSYQLYSWLQGLLFPAPANRPVTPNPPTNPPANPPNEPANPAGIRRRGNVHRVTADRPDDDDNNTWNGNSTQQM